MHKKLLIFLLIIMSSILHAQQVDERKNSTPEEKVMRDCDQRVFYEIFIRSFYDSNGDGIGDLNGITEKLDYLQQLGIGGLWITPFNASPSYHKYDVTDYYNVDPQYGTLEDFKRLVSEAHRRNILVLMDLVVNHTSRQHPWFIASVQNDPEYRDYFIWEKNPPKAKDGGWYIPSTRNENSIDNEKYFGFFSPSMPDLNFDNPEVRKEIIAIGKWWLKETDVDGFRLDAAQHIYDADHPAKNVQWWKEFTDSLKHENPDVITIGECWNKYPLMAQYTSALSGAFNFQLSWAILKSLQEEKNDSVAELLSKIRSEYAKYSDHFIDPIFLSNHDNNRILSDLDNNNAKAKLAACIYLTLPGTPFIYYGEEIGMRGKKPDSLIREPFLWGKDGKEEPHQTNWELGINSTNKTVTPLSGQLNDRSSSYNHYKKLIALRKATPALTSRNFIAAPFQGQLLSYIRGTGDSSLLVIHNLSAEKISFDISSERLAAYSHLTFSSSRKVRQNKNNYRLPAYSTIILSKP